MLCLLSIWLLLITVFLLVQLLLLLKLLLLYIFIVESVINIIVVLIFILRLLLLLHLLVSHDGHVRRQLLYDVIWVVHLWLLIVVLRSVLVIDLLAELVLTHYLLLLHLLDLLLQCLLHL